MTTDADGWRTELVGWLAMAALMTAAFWIGGGWRSGIGAGGAMLTVTLVVHLGRRRFDALRVVGGAGDERNRDLYVRATASTGTFLWALITGWWLLSVVRGEHNRTLLVLAVAYSVAIFVTGAYHARRG